MTGFEVVQGDLRSAAQSIDSAAGGVRGADASGKVGQVSGALPGSQSGPAAGDLATKWQKRFENWATDAESQSTRLRDSAQEYDNSDYLADQRLRVLMRRTGEPGY